MIIRISNPAWCKLYKSWGVMNSMETCSMNSFLSLGRVQWKIQAQQKFSSKYYIPPLLDFSQESVEDDILDIPLQHHIGLVFSHHGESLHFSWWRHSCNQDNESFLRAINSCKQLQPSHSNIASKAYPKGYQDIPPINSWKNSKSHHVGNYPPAQWQKVYRTHQEQEITCNLYLLQFF